MYCDIFSRASMALILLAAVSSSRADDGEQEIDVEDLPAKVVAAIEKKFPEGKITEAEMEVEDGVTVYEVEVEDGDDEFEVEVSADGEILDIEEDEDDEDEDEDEDEDDEDGDDNK